MLIVNGWVIHGLSPGTTRRSSTTFGVGDEIVEDRAHVFRVAVHVVTNRTTRHPARTMAV
jgi:hypothetical protein